MPRYCGAELQDEVLQLVHLIGYGVAYTYPKTVRDFGILLGGLVSKGQFGSECRAVDRPKTTQEKAESPELRDRAHH